MDLDDAQHESTPHRRRGRLVAVVAVGLVVALVGGWWVYQRAVEPAEPSSFYTPPDPLPEGRPPR